MTDHDPNETAASEAAATPDDGARVSNINRPWLIRIVIITTCLLGYAGWSLYDAYVAYPERGEAYSSWAEWQYLSLAIEADRTLGGKVEVSNRDEGGVEVTLGFVPKSRNLIPTEASNA